MISFFFIFEKFDLLPKFFDGLEDLLLQVGLLQDLGLVLGHVVVVDADQVSEKKVFFIIFINRIILSIVNFLGHLKRHSGDLKKTIFILGLPRGKLSFLFSLLFSPKFNRKHVEANYFGFIPLILNLRLLFGKCK